MVILLTFFSFFWQHYQQQIFIKNIQQTLINNPQILTAALDAAPELLVSTLQKSLNHSRFMETYRQNQTPPMSPQILGDLNLRSTPVVIHFFADFDCPFSAQMWRSLKAILFRFPKQITVRPIFLSDLQNQTSKLAAYFFHLLYEQNPEEALIFADEVWSLKRENKLNVQNLQSLLESFDMNQRPFGILQNHNPELLDLLSKNRKLAQNLNVTGTPHVWINQWPMAGYAPPWELEPLVEEILETSAKVKEQLAQSKTSY